MRLYLLLSISLFAFSELSYASACSTKVGLDAHVHSTAIDIENIKNDMGVFLEQSCAEFSFLISPSYMIRDSFTKKPKKTIQEMDKTTSELVNSYASRLLGLCGISFDSQYSLDMISSCLKLNGMIGMKIRLGEINSAVAITKFFDAIRKKLLDNNLQPKIILAHLPHLHGYRRQAGRPLYTVEEEITDLRILHSSITDLLQLAENFADSNFVIAHSLYDPREVKVLADRVKSRGLKNIWIETSTSLTSMMPFNGMEPSGQNTFSAYVDSWRYFGINRVIFGSDSVLGDIEKGILDSYGSRSEVDEALENYNLQVLKILELMDLSSKEKKMILQENAKTLLKGVL